LHEKSAPDGDSFESLKRPIKNQKHNKAEVSVCRPFKKSFRGMLNNSRR